MPGLKRFVQNLGWDGVTFGVIGLTAIIFAVVGVFGSWPLSSDQTNYILIGAVGALMAAVVNLTAKRKAEIQELKDELGTTETKLLDYQHEYIPSLVASVSRSKHHITEMFVNWATPRPGENYLHFDPELHKRIYEVTSKRGRVMFQQVHTVYHVQGLEELLHRILLFEGRNYFIRHYKAPPVAMPVLHVFGIDDDVYYIGVGYPKGEPIKNQVLFIRDAKLVPLMTDYWRVLWNDGTPLNEGGVINDVELRRIGVDDLGMSDAEFDKMKARVTEQVQKDKRKYGFR